MHAQAVKRAHNILNQDKQKIAKDFAPDKKVNCLFSGTPTFLRRPDGTSLPG